MATTSKNSRYYGTQTQQEREKTRQAHHCRQDNYASSWSKRTEKREETRTGKKREGIKTAQTELRRRVYPWPHGGTRDLFSWALHPIIGLSPSDSIYFTCDLLPAIALAQVAKVVLHTIVLFSTLAIVEAI